MISLFLSKRKKKVKKRLSSTRLNICANPVHLQINCGKLAIA